MFSLRICRLAPSLSTLLCTSVSAQRKPLFTSPLPIGVRLDPAGEAVDLGSLPINLVLTPEKDRAVVVLSGWREQGVQVVDLKTRNLTQTLLQDGAFYGAVFSPDGHHLCVSGGNTDILFVYAWNDGAATLENKFELAKAKTADGTGTNYPAGLEFSPNGKFLYVAEDVGDRLAVVNAATGEITQRFSTDHYPYGVALTADDQVFVSDWRTSFTRGINRSPQRIWPKPSPSLSEAKSKPISSCSPYLRPTRSSTALNMAMCRHAWSSTSRQLKPRTGAQS